MTDATTIPAAVMGTVQRQADALAVVDGGLRISYGELGLRIRAATRAMMAVGVGPGDRVAVWAPNGIGWIEAALGAQCAGAALVPINTRWKGAEAAHVLAATKARVLATSTGFLDTDTVAMLPGAPTVYSAILDHPRLQERELGSLRVAVTGAADIPVSLIQETCTRPRSRTPCLPIQTSPRWR